MLASAVRAAPGALIGGMKELDGPAPDDVPVADELAVVEVVVLMLEVPVAVEGAESGRVSGAGNVPMLSPSWSDIVSTTA